MSKNLIVHASGDDFEIKSSLKTFLEDISLGHLLTIFEEEDVSLDMIPHMSHEDLKQIGVKTFGQRFLIISAGNKLNLVAKEDTKEENNFHETNPMAEDIPDKFSITDIMEVQLPYERSYSSAKVKNAPRKSEELVISNLEDYCTGDRGDIMK